MSESSATRFKICNEPPEGSGIAFQYGRVVPKKKFPGLPSYSISSQDDDAVEIRRVVTPEELADLRETVCKYDFTRIVFDHSNVWKSIIYPYAELDRFQGVFLEEFLPPFQGGKERDRKLSFLGKEYVWVFEEEVIGKYEEAGEYSLVEEKKREGVCSLYPTFDSDGRLKTAALEIYNWDEHHILLPAIIVSATAFFNICKHMRASCICKDCKFVKT